MSLRTIEGDEHYGHLGLGAVTASAANAFSAAIVDAIVEPDFIISTKSGARALEIDVDDVLVWDCKEWVAHHDGTPDIIGGEIQAPRAEAGITKDNTVNGNEAPTARTVAQGTRPGGNGAAAAGLAGGGPGNRTVGDEQPTRFVEHFFFWGASNEQQDSTGQINHTYRSDVNKNNTKYSQDGNDAHYLMTGAHYHLWVDDDALAAASTFSLGMKTRRMSIDLKELMFDRAVLLSILDALVVSS